MTKEGAVYTYFYSSIKRWPANKKKNQAHLVLCAECPQINRIKWAFSPHVKFRWKDWHWMCTLILCSWNRVLPNSNVLSSSSQLLAPHFCLSLLADSTLRWRCGRNIIPLNSVFLKLLQESWQREGTAGRPQFPCFLSAHPAQAPKPMLSKCTVTWHWATPRVEALGDQTYLKMRFRDLVQILAVHCTATGRAFSCKIMNTITISHLQSPRWSPPFFQYLALLNWLPSLRPSTGKCFCMCLKPSDFNGRQACASVFYWLECSDECISFPPVLFCTKFCTFIINYLV